MKIGYARVSTQDQNLSVQMDQLRAAGCDQIFREKVSGKSTEGRTELRRLLRELRAGDVLIVAKLDRLARNARNLLVLLDELNTIGASILSLGEPWADTTSPAGKLIMTVFAGIAEFERSRILERCNAGRVDAMDRGVKFGRKPKLSAPQLAELPVMLDRGESPTAIAKLFNVHFSTIYRHPVYLKYMEGRA